MNHLLVRGICIKDNTLLLAFHKDRNYFFLPGGHIETGEAAVNALRREIGEETNLFARNEKFLSILEHAYEVDTEMHHEITLLFSFDVSSLSVSSKVSHLGFEWVLLSNLDKINFLPKILIKYITHLPTNSFPPFVSSLINEQN